MKNCGAGDTHTQGTSLKKADDEGAFSDNLEKCFY